MGALLPFAAMLFRIIAQVSNMVVCKAAMSGGLNQYVLILYSTALSSIIFLFCSLLFNRAEHKLVTFSILFRIFLLALIGSTSQIFGYLGIKYSSPTLGAAMLNLIPAFTFILSVIFRMERLDWRSNISRAKALGTFISIAGAFVVTLYKGPPILMKSSVTAPFDQFISPSQLNWILGGFFLAVEALTGSAWYVAQAFLLKEFSALSTFMFYQTFFGLILNGAYCLVMVKDPNAWNLRLDMGLFSVLYSAVVGVVLCNFLVSWCLLKIGPFHVVMFKPLSIVFAIAMGIFFLGDVLCLGSLIGSIIIVIGFYSVIWGKAKEEKTSREDAFKTIKSLGEKAPLLENNAERHKEPCIETQTL